MMKFIFKLFKFILTLLIIFIIFTYITSKKINMSFDETVAYFKIVGSQIIDINNSENILTSTDNLPINSSKNNHYYYSQLDENGKIIYTALENNIDNLKKDNHVIDFSTTFNELLNKSTGRYTLNKAFQSALDAFSYDHPELFYIDISKISLNISCVSIAHLETYTVKICPHEDTKNYLNNSFKSEQQVDIAIKRVESIKKEIINNISDYSTYQKIKSVHDLLVNSIKYDETYSMSNSHNIYGALINKEVVCEGYAKAFKYIMDALDVECILVSGNATNSSNETETHMWNYVRLNNEWYGVDVTWDDPIIIGGPSKNNIRHDYFLKGYYTFCESHDASGKITDTGMLFKLPTLSYDNFK